MLGRNFGSSLTCDCVPLDGEKGKYFCVTVDRFTSHHKLRQLDRMNPSELLLPCFVSGIVPNFCRELFRCLTDRSSGDRIQYQVYLSMIEIYNETVRDLLDPAKSDRGLKVREHPKKGFYGTNFSVLLWPKKVSTKFSIFIAEGLKITRVNNYDEIEHLMTQGTINRTVASTNMNATSSRGS